MDEHNFIQSMRTNAANGDPAGWLSGQALGLLIAPQESLLLTFLSHFVGEGISLD